MSAYLVCYDYGMGGTWYWMEAPSSDAIRAVFPYFRVFDAPPDWWATRPLKNLRTYTLGQPMDAMLRNLAEEAARKHDSKQ